MEPCCGGGPDARKPPREFERVDASADVCDTVLDDKRVRTRRSERLHAFCDTAMKMHLEINMIYTLASLSRHCLLLPLLYVLRVARRK